MSILFSDIYDGIRAIRISKGVCERDILNYVQEKAGGCMKVGNVLKTIRTLKKLVDDGELIKKGNRYCFPPKDDCKKKEEEEEEDEEEAPEEENGDELDMDPDECDEADDDEEEGEEEEEEGEEDEDEEEEEEEEEDDDDDGGDEDEEDEDEDEEEDESCNENEDAGIVGSGDSQNPETTPPENPAIRSTQGEPDCAAAQKENSDISYSRSGIPRSIDSNTKNNGRKAGKEKNILEQNNGTDRRETIAFCARDFIDSLADSKSDGGSEERIEITEGSERGINMKRFPTPSKSPQPPRKKINMDIFRSRSPLSGRKRDFSCLRQELPHNLGFTGAAKEIMGESINSKMELDVEAKSETFGVAQKSPVRDSSTPEAQMDLQDESDRRNALIEPGTVNRNGSSDDVMENINKETLKLMQLNPASYSSMVWYPLEDSDNAHDILLESHSFENSNCVIRKDSMCSICEKKKRIS